MGDRIEVESKIGQLFLEEEVALLKEEREGVAVFILKSLARGLLRLRKRGQASVLGSTQT